VFHPVLIISKKRDGKELTKDEIQWFIRAYTDDQIPDYQMSALLMAIFWRGMTVAETAHLTDAMLYSGSVLSFDDDKVIDKHSTGGVGDKTSFILAPIAAAAGVKVPMVAGRGLGHTGGTVDKAEAIPGFNTNLKLDQFSRQLVKYGIVMMGQTSELAPADKKIYALRDVTGTIESIPLITASIMSKKLAEGASGLVMDIKFGSGAFMKTLPQARALARSIRDTALRFDRKIMISITDMNRPLGRTIGHGFEIIECIDVLKGCGPKDLTDLSLHLAGGMIYLAGLSKNLANGIKTAKELVASGKALEKFAELIKLQGGNPNCIHDYTIINQANEQTIIKASKAGFISSLNPIELGMACADLGGGRKQTGDKLDLGVGITILKNSGDKVKKGDEIAIVHHNKNQVLELKDATIKINKAYTFTAKASKKIPLIVETHVHFPKQVKSKKTNRRDHVSKN
jgi:pyrimidine-nucleoside phosphorylase